MTAFTFFVLLVYILIYFNGLYQKNKILPSLSWGLKRKKNLIRNHHASNKL